MCEIWSLFQNVGCKKNLIINGGGLESSPYPLKNDIFFIAWIVECPLNSSKKGWDASVNYPFPRRLERRPWIEMHSGVYIFQKKKWVFGRLGKKYDNLYRKKWI